MKRPPFKTDGRGGQLRWTSAEGKPKSAAGRVSYLFGYVFAMQVLAGTGRDFEIRLGRGPWHAIEATPEEVRAASTGVGGKGMVRRGERIRVERVAAGKPVVT